MAVLADEANVSADGKLNVLGIFDRINASQIPCIHPRLVFAFRIRADYHDSKRQVVIRIRLLDEDGRVLLNARADMEVGPIPPGGVASVSQIITVNQLPFESEGMYKFEIVVRPPAADPAAREPLLRHETPFQVLRSGTGGK